jgi:HSP20 family protein
MYLTRWNPYRGIRPLRNTMDRLFTDAFVWPLRGWAGRTEEECPLAIDMVERDDEYVVQADLPGLKPDDVDISLTDHRLMIRGAFRTQEETDEDNIHIRERYYGKFQRMIALPSDVQTDNINAEFEDGILTLSLPKTEEAQPKRIEVRSRS